MKDTFKESTSGLIANTLLNIAEGLTGIGASEKTKLLLSIGHIFQNLRGGQFLTSLQREWERYKKAGRINNDYQFTDQSYTCFHEILDFLENDIPDEIRFNILKRIFLVSATEKKSNRESALPQQYMRICKKLTSGEILVLNAAYEASKDESFIIGAAQHNQLGGWFVEIAKRSKLKHKELVEIHEEGLVAKKLLTGRSLQIQSLIPIGENFRLTPLACDICDFLQSYEET